MKGHRIKLQDIIEGVYNPLNSNNGCWISCEFRVGNYFTKSSFNLISIHSRGIPLSEPMGRDSVTDSRKLVGTDSDVEYNLCEILNLYSNENGDKFEDSFSFATRFSKSIIYLAKTKLFMCLHHQIRYLFFCVSRCSLFSFEADVTSVTSMGKNQKKC